MDLSRCYITAIISKHSGSQQYYETQKAQTVNVVSMIWLFVNVIGPFYRTLSRIAAVLRSSYYTLC